MRASTQMGQNDQFVLKLLCAFQNVVEMHVAELVDLFLAVLRSEKSHLRDQHFSLVNIRMGIQSLRRCIPVKHSNGVSVSAATSMPCIRRSRI
jgi:hypothetical protein